MPHESTFFATTVHGSHVYSHEPIAPRDGFALTHILVPTALTPRERSAIRLGLQLASAHQAKITVLHVLSTASPSPSMHWLDAIDNLYQALSRPNGAHVRNGDIHAIEATRRNIQLFLDRHVTRDAWIAANLQVECRIGDITTEIRQFADYNAVDLLILCCDVSRGWLPSLPQRIRRLLRTTQVQVALVRPEMTNGFHHAADRPLHQGKPERT